MENQIQENQIEETKDGYCKWCNKKLRQRKELNILPYHNTCFGKLEKYRANINMPKASGNTKK